MVIVSSAKVRRDLREELTTEFPDADFRFYINMEAAQHDLPEADILITYGEDLNETHIEKAERLKWIMVISAGLDEMPLSKCKEKGITVTNARGIHQIPMAEYTLAAMLQTAKGMKSWFENEKAAHWEDTFKMNELANSTVTVIGPGAIGGEIARLAKAFRMKTIGVSRSGSPVNHVDHVFTIENMNKALSEADYVVAVLPHTDATDKLIGADNFAAMKESAVFINIGRGKTVDEEALLNALKNQVIAHAVLDVFEEEPLPKEHPFWEMDKVTITPHCSAQTSGYQPRAFEIFKDNLKHYIQGTGEWKNRVDLNRGY